MGNQEHWAGERRRGAAGAGIHVVDGLAAAVVVVFALVFAATSATGATITIPNGADFTVYNSTTGGSDPPVAGDTLLSVGTFEPFDTSLGILTSVNFQIAGTGAAWLRLSNLVGGDYTAWLGAYLSFGVLGGSTLWASDLVGLGGALTTTVSPDGSVGPDWSTGVPYEIEFSDGNGLPIIQLSINENLDLFKVTGIQFAGAVQYVWHVGWPDGSSASVSATTAGGGLAVAPYGLVTYEYTPVPEPGTGLLVGIGLGSIGAARYRRSSR